MMYTSYGAMTDGKAAGLAAGVIELNSMGSQLLVTGIEKCK